MLALATLFVTQSRYFSPNAAFTAALIHGVVSTATYLATLGACIVFYRITPGHKLAHIPGPFLAKVSQLWLVRRAIHGQLRHDMQALHRQYGDVVRIGA